jgi:serine/threonine protein kinase
VIGETVKHYRIESMLGAGGMGEVYRARDTKLGRTVALKVLPEAFARDADRISRFDREAKLLAALNHPNIAALYGTEEADGRHFLVMELVEGETLADVLHRGVLPVVETLRIAHQIAEGLEAAHEKGIVHRDLRPANVKIARDGRIKILDFGLAKAMEPASLAGADVGGFSNSPTISMAATNAGIILGTAAYMSPEQANGLAADARSDLFSFGSLLYEMLTGRQPFQGKTLSEVLASVLVRDPDWSLMPPNLNPRIRELVRRCLEKEPKRRWHVLPCSFANLANRWERIGMGIGSSGARLAGVF